MNGCKKCEWRPKLGIVTGISFADGPAPDCEFRKGEGGATAATADPWAPRRACGWDGLPKITGLCDNAGSRMGVIHFPGTTHKRLILSRCPIPL